MLFPCALLLALAVGVLVYRPGPQFGRLLPDHSLTASLTDANARWISDTWGGALYMLHGKPGLKLFFGDDSVRRETLSFWFSKKLSVFLFEDGVDATAFRAWLVANHYRTEPISVYRGAPVSQIFAE